MRTTSIFALIAILVCFSIAVRAQKVNTEPAFGQIAKKDLEQTAFEQYPGVGAVILFDYGSCIFTKSSTFKRHKRIKILTPEGYPWGNDMIPLFQQLGSHDKIISFRASAFNLVDGKVKESPLQGTSAFKDKVNDDIKLMSFALPDVRVGTIVEIYYEVANYGFVSWMFQERIPTLVSNYTFAVFLGVDFSYIIQGYRRPQIEDGFNFYNATECREVKLVMKDIPAFESEPFITNPDDYISKARFYITTIKLEQDKRVFFWTSYIKDWTDVPGAYNYQQFPDGYVNSTFFLQDVTATVTKNSRTAEEKIIAIHDYVRSYYTWNRVNSTLAPNLKKAYTTKQGNSADINLTLLAMLRYANVMAEPVLISTKEHGMLRPDMPSMDQFNRVIVQTSMNGKSVFLDATDKYLSYNYLPIACATLLGYVASDTHQGWAELHELSKTTVNVNADLTLTSDGKLSGVITIEKNGHEAADGRRDYKALGAGGFVAKHFRVDGIEIKKESFTNSENLLENFKETYTIETVADGKGTFGTLYLNPLLVGRHDENPYRETERKYPVDLGFAKVMNYHAKIKLPQGYRVDEIPQPKLAVLPDNAGKFIYNAATSAKNEITVTSQLAINKSYFLQNEYPDLREFMNVVIAKQTENIVIKKVQ